VLLTAIMIATHWRTVLRWLIVLASTAVIATFGYGLVVIWQTTHHIAGVI
jgi:hypothetical protein